MSGWISVEVGGKISNDGFTALISLFNGNTEMTDSNSPGFKLLWEKDIKVGLLKNVMRRKSELKNRMVIAVPSIISYYKWYLLNFKHNYSVLLELNDFNWENNINYFNFYHPFNLTYFIYNYQLTYYYYFIVLLMFNRYHHLKFILNHHQNFNCFPKIKF